MTMLLQKTFVCLLILLSLNLTVTGENFKFAVLGDSQFHNPEVFENMIREVDLLKPDFVIQSGDMIHGYTWDEERILLEWDRFRSQIAPLSMPFYPVPGNHDVTTTPMVEIYREIWGNNKLFHSFDHENSHFVILNTEYRMNHHSVAGEQLEWLKADLKNNRDAKHIFLFMHSPVWRRNPENWEILAGVLNRYPNIRGVYAAYSNENCFEEVDGIPCFIVNSSARMNYYAPAVGYSFQFLYVSVNGDEVTEAYIPAGTVKPHDYVTRKERDRAEPYLIPASGGQIPDPADEPLNFIYSFPLENRAEDINVYTIRWEIPNPAFTVEPRDQAVFLTPGQVEDIYVRITAPSRDFASYSLPYALIETYYNTMKNEAVVLSSRHELCIPRRARTNFTERSPWIDGLLDDTAWQWADVFTDFQINKAGEKAEAQTWVRTLWDQRFFYIGIHCEEPLPEKLVAHAEGGLPFTWGDDDIEIFIDADHDLDTFARAFVNTRGTTFNTLPEEGVVPRWYDRAVHVGKDYWSVEMKMPMSVLGVEDQPTSATQWGFNVRRHRQKPERIQSDWLKMDNYPYEPWRFGVLEFKP